ncbi:MAG: L,D-transpeptidase family protein [Firmicutes bacterium]|nr:L,D-transpeptidase family protein [Bacillota bacterium]
MRRQKKMKSKLIAMLLTAAMVLTMSMPAAAFAAEPSDSGSGAASADQTEPAVLFSEGSGPAAPEGQAELSDPDPADPAALSEGEEPSDPADPGQTDPAEPSDPGQEDPTDPTNPTDPTEPEPPKYFSTYRIEVTNGVMRCWWYNASGVKTTKPQKNKYFIVKFDKGSKTEGTAIKKIGKAGTLYYFNKKGKGKKYTGWYKKGKAKYYFKKGSRLRGTKKVKKIWYVFSKSTGKMTRRIGDGIDKKFQSYSSSTKYMIVVKLKEHKVRIYHGKKGKWKRIHAFKCSVGAPSTPTVKGTFTIGSRGRYFNTGSTLRCWYYTQFYGNYLFHSVLYDRSPSPSHLVNGRLGANISHGCIRMALGNAKWIYSNIPSGTKVVIY